MEKGRRKKTIEDQIQQNDIKYVSSSLRNVQVSAKRAKKLKRKNLQHRLIIQETRNDFKDKKDKYITNFIKLKLKNSIYYKTNSILTKLYNEIMLIDENNISELQIQSTIFSKLIEYIYIPDIYIPTCSSFLLSCNCDTNNCQIDFYYALLTTGIYDILLAWMLVSFDNINDKNDQLYLKEIQQKCIYISWYMEWILKKKFISYCEGKKDPLFNTYWWIITPLDQILHMIQLDQIDTNSAYSLQDFQKSKPFHSHILPILIRILINAYNKNGYGTLHYSDEIPKTKTTYKDSSILPSLMYTLALSSDDLAHKALEYLLFSILTVPTNATFYLQSKDWISWFSPILLAEKHGNNNLQIKITRLTIGMIITICNHSFIYNDNFFNLLCIISDDLENFTGWNQIIITLIRIILCGFINKQLNSIKKKKWVCDITHNIWSNLFDLLHFIENFLLYSNNSNQIRITNQRRFDQVGIHSKGTGTISPDIALLNGTIKYITLIQSIMNTNQLQLHLLYHSKKLKNLFINYKNKIDDELNFYIDVKKLINNLYNNEINLSEIIIPLARQMVSRNMNRNDKNVITASLFSSKKTKEMIKKLTTMCLLIRSERLKIHNDKNDDDDDVLPQFLDHPDKNTQLKSIQVGIESTNETYNHSSIQDTQSISLDKAKVLQFNKDQLLQSARHIMPKILKRKMSSQKDHQQQKKIVSKMPIIQEDHDRVKKIALQEEEGVEQQDIKVKEEEEEELFHEQVECTECKQMLIVYNDDETYIDIHDQIFERRGQLYCHGCYLKLFCSCNDCNKIFGDTNDETVVELNVIKQDADGNKQEQLLQYHIACYKCKMCHLPLFENDNVCYHEGDIYCLNDYKTHFSKICHHCNQTIEGLFKYVNGVYWHPEHFFCNLCYKQLNDINFYNCPIDAKPLDDDLQKYMKHNICCSDCYHLSLNKICHVCNKIIKGASVDIQDKGVKFHLDCYKCSFKDCKTHHQNDDDDDEGIEEEINQQKKKLSFMKAIWDFQATRDDQISFNKGDIIYAIEKSLKKYPDWAKGAVIWSKNKVKELNFKTGIYPVSYVKEFHNFQKIDLNTLIESCSLVNIFKKNLKINKEKIVALN